MLIENQHGSASETVNIENLNPQKNFGFNHGSYDLKFYQHNVCQFEIYTHRSLAILKVSLLFC